MSWGWRDRVGSLWVVLVLLGLPLDAAGGAGRDLPRAAEERRRVTEAGLLASVSPRAWGHQQVGDAGPRTHLPGAGGVRHGR
jgi:hypothetical protein